MVLLIAKHVLQDATIYTDEAPVLKKLKRTYKHDSVKHTLNIYV